MNIELLKKLQEIKLQESHGIEALRDCLKIQGSNGNWDYDPYMHGLYNGLACAEAILTETEPQYKNAPDQWLKDKSNEGISIAVPDGYHKHPLLKKAFEAKRTGKEIFDDMEHDYMPA